MAECPKLGAALLATNFQQGPASNFQRIHFLPFSLLNPTTIGEATKAELATMVGRWSRRDRVDPALHSHARNYTSCPGACED